MNLINTIKRFLKSDKLSNTNSVIRKIKMDNIYKLDLPIQTNSNIDYEKIKEYFHMFN